MSSKMLGLADGLKLDKLLSAYLPEGGIPEDITSYAHRLIEQLSPHEYLDAVLLMSGESQEEILKKDSKDVLEIFLTGLVTNRVWELREFCKGLGVKYG